MLKAGFGMEILSGVVEWRSIRSDFAGIVCARN